MDSIVLIVVFLDIFTMSVALNPSWNMHYTCGQTISQSDRGGFLVLNSDLLPTGHQYDCRVVIQPESTKSSSTSGYHVLFHFSDFEVGKHCQDTNVTVLDGDGINMKPIEGLKNPLCGSNSSLTKDVTFTTQSYFITVLFQRNAAGMNFKSKFNLTFLSFSDGSCGSGDENLFSCTNKRCVDKKFTCQNINPCGDNSDCPSSDLSDSLENVIEAVKYVSIVVFMIFTLGIFYKFFRHRGFRSDRSCDRCCGCLGNILDDVHYRCSECRCDCSSCRNCCSRCKNCCGGLVARIVALYTRVKSRFASNIEEGQDQQTNESAQGSGQDTSQDRSDINTRMTSQHSTSASETSRNYQNEAYNSEEDSYSSDFDSIHSEIDTRRPTDAPPSYREAAAAPRPLPAVPKEPTAPPSSPDTTAPPSYDEAVANMTKYTRRK